MELDDELLELQQSHVAAEEIDSMNNSSDFNVAPTKLFAATNEVVMSYNNSENSKSFDMNFENNNGKIVAPKLSSKVPQLNLNKVKTSTEVKDKKIDPKKLSTSSSNIPIRKNNPLTSSTSAISKLKPKEPQATIKKSNPFLENQPLPLEKKKVSHFAKEEIEQFMLQQKLKRLKQKEEALNVKHAEKKKQKEKLEVCLN